MIRILKCVVVGIGCFAFSSSTSAAPIPQNSLQPAVGNGQRSVNQTRNEIAALPASSDVAPDRAPANSASAQAARTTQPYSTFYRQASAQTDVYSYPATGPPRVGNRLQSNFAPFRNNANARPTSQMSLGSNTSTGNLGAGNVVNYQAPVYNLNPNAGLATSPTRVANSRSPVEQQQASTISARPTFAAQGNQMSTAQQAQAQAIELARQAQVQQAQAQLTLAQAQQAQARATQIAMASQPTTAFRQPTYQLPTLGLGRSPVRVAQNCRCTTGYIPVGTVNPAAACLTPTLNPAGGIGVVAPTVSLQNMPVGAYLGTGIIGQPTAYVDGQPVRNLLRYISP